MKNKILIPFEKIEELIDGRKFFSVNRIVEQIDYVLANSEEEAENYIVAESDIIVDKYNTDVVVQQIKCNSRLDYDLKDEIPFGISVKSNLTNLDILDFLKEIERREKIKKELDEKQLKFNI